MLSDELFRLGAAGRIEVGLNDLKPVEGLAQLRFSEAVGDVAGRCRGEKSIDVIGGQPCEGVAGGGVGQEVRVLGDLGQCGATAGELDFEAVAHDQQGGDFVDGGRTHDAGAAAWPQ